MKLIVGLGNPGKEYEHTRHNVGFDVLDEIAQSFHVEINQKKFKALITSIKVENETILLMKPMTFMNLSGEAVREAMQFYHIQPQDVVIIYDDLDLNPGKIRLRAKGSAGGHNGIKSIVAQIKTQEFPRIRLGIGKDPNIPVINWVLGKIRKEDLDAHQEAIQLAKDAAIYSMSHTFMDTMNRFNRK